MLLLPDIQIGENILSIQDPYTLNGYIVTDIIMEITMNACISGNIIIKNENDYRLCINSYELKSNFKREMEYFISRHGSYAHVEGRRDMPNWSNYLFFDYINDIKKQCDNINRRQNNNFCYNSYGENNYINALKADLRRQGRIINNTVRYLAEENLERYNRAFHDYVDFPIPSYTVDNMGDNMGYISFGGRNNLESTQNKYIHNYSYKPEYIPYYMPNEDKDTTLLLGAEIEVDCGGESEEHAKKVLEIICGIDPNNIDKALENKMYCTHDGSLKAGIEFDTMPASLEYHKNKMRYKEMFEYLDEHGYKAHDTETCGLHIHVDRKYLGKSELIQQLTISKILYILEKFNDEICVIARKNNSYSRFVGKGKDEKSIVELYAKYKDYNKYVALNLKHKESIEFRCFKGTLKYKTFILTLEFVKNIVDYAKSVNIEEIELIKWTDLINTFSDELKEYYNTRLEIEKKKKEDKNTITATADQISMTDIINAITLIGSCITINDSSPVFVNREFLENHIDVSTVPSTYTMPTYSISFSSDRTLEEELKNKIKSLKKKINNSNNYLEKKNLQKELNEVQKELKKEKKKNKLTNNTNTATT